MPSLPQPIVELIAALNKLPGVGPRSAERLAIHIVQSEANLVRELVKVLVQARERIRSCETCGALTEQSPCAICSDPRRDASIVCGADDTCEGIVTCADAGACAFDCKLANDKTISVCCPAGGCTGDSGACAGAKYECK